MHKSYRTAYWGLFVLGVGGWLVLSTGCAPSNEENIAQQLSSAQPITAEDPTAIGPLATTSSEYRLKATIDNDILTDRRTEIWAQLYRPQQLADDTKYPVILFLHGNHGTCGTRSNPRIDDNTSYTYMGTCPTNYVVTPNHLGYGYVAERLASWGYIVVSINANLGITAGSGISGDPGLNLARGRLVLKHLYYLSEWNNTPNTTPETIGVDLAGKLDFSNVGLMGHSRGGEGVRAAYNQYLDNDSPWPARIQDKVTIKGIFEIGPVDGQTGRVLNAIGTKWNVLLPMCDGDVYNLQGMQPFDRMMAVTEELSPSPKGMFAVWGANHNYYNTEWQTTDSSGCSGEGNKALFTVSGTSGSVKQQQTGLVAMMAFFRSYVGDQGTPKLAQLLDPQYGLPSAITDITRVERAYSDSSSDVHNIILEEFNKAVGTSTLGFPVTAEGISLKYQKVSEHASSIKAAAITWESDDEENIGYFQTEWAAEDEGIDLSQMTTLSFRISRQSNKLNPAKEPTNFSINLLGPDGTLSNALQLNDFVEILGPVGGSYSSHSTLQSVRIPLIYFKNIDLEQVRGLRFTFDDTMNGAIYVANIRASNAPNAVNPVVQQPLDTAPASDPDTTPITFTAGNSVKEIRTVVQTANPQEKAVEISLTSKVAFPVNNELVVLKAGDVAVDLSRNPTDGNTNELIFTLSPEQFNNINNGDKLFVQYGHSEAPVRWDFGTIQKN